jgi:mono/diheme cytochrome c family protein
MKILSYIGALAIIAAVAAGAYFFGGFYNVAATQADPDIVRWALEYVREASINRHATDTPPAGLDDPATIQAGARAYAARGCTACHGIPGVDGSWTKFSEGLRPDPPDLKEGVKDLTTTQIFWIVKNGINMTGMPSFATAGAPDQEIWAIAAFAKKSPEVPEADYRTWTADVAPPGASAAPK